MANYIYNKLKIIGSTEEVKSVRDFLKGRSKSGEEVLYIDFNKIEPVPECLSVPSGGIGNYAYRLLFENSDAISSEDLKVAHEYFCRCSENEQRKGIELAFKYNYNYKNIGYVSMESWRDEHWGTDRNAFDQELEAENVIIFYTAWNHVSLLMSRLSQIFPKVTFEYFSHTTDYSFEGENESGFKITLLQGEEINSAEYHNWELVSD